MLYKIPIQLTFNRAMVVLIKGIGYRHYNEEDAILISEKCEKVHIYNNLIYIYYFMLERF